MNLFYTYLKQILFIIFVCAYGNTLCAQTERAEVLFAKGTALTVPVVIESEGVKLTTIGRAFLDTQLDVTYNVYEEGELDWNNGTKLVFEAKDNVTGIVFEGTSLQHASADKGAYANGCWKGNLEKGEKLTLESTEGIIVYSIKVLYNGAEAEGDGDQDVADTEITYKITKTNWSTIGAATGETIGTVSCDAKQFDHYEFTITCDDDPDIFISFANLRSTKGNITCYSWVGGKHDLYNGYNYTLTILAFDVPYLNADPIATATYKFVGTGVSPTVYSDIAVKGISLKKNSLGLGYNVKGNTFEVTFAEPVSNVKAYAAMGLDGSVNFTTTKSGGDGKTWTVIMPESILAEEGSVNVNITATDKNGLPLKEANTVHPFAFNLVVDASLEPDPNGGIDEEPADDEPVSTDPAIKLNITKTDWSVIGNENGEAIGTAELINSEAFDHIDAEIRCQEDPDQYISFAASLTNGGNIVCYSWERGHFDLNAGYHYTLTIKAFDVPYYGAEPVATATYDFIGTGVEATKYSDIQVAKLNLKENVSLVNGYDADGTTFDVTFNAPVSKVTAWMALGFYGTAAITAEKQSEDGTVWTVKMPESVLSEEGSVNIMVQAWDADGVMAKGENGDHAFSFNIFVSTSVPEDDPEVAINAVKVSASTSVFTLSGVKINESQMQKGNVYIVNGKTIRK